MYNGEYTCELCDDNRIETQKHLLECEKIINNCPKLYENIDVEYEDIYGEPEKQLEITRLYSEILSVKADLEQNDQPH